MNRKLWNVKLSVVSLEEAETAEEAVAQARRNLLSMGLDVYEGDEPDVFESESLAPHCRAHLEARSDCADCERERE